MKNKIKTVVALMCLSTLKVSAFNIDSVYYQVLEDKDKACEVVKSAIIVSKANKKMVAKIVQVAIEASPEDIRIITQCAIAVAPDALKEILEVYSKYTKTGGDGAKSAKSFEKETFEKWSQPVTIPNPLDIIRIPETIITTTPNSVTPN